MYESVAASLASKSDRSEGRSAQFSRLGGDGDTASGIAARAEKMEAADA